MPESFMTSGIGDSYDGDTVATEKLRYFTDYPGLIELREHIRDELGVGAQPALRTKYAQTKDEPRLTAQGTHRYN